MGYVPINSSNVVSFVASIGDTVKICRPVGYPPHVLGINYEYTSSDTSINGFRILYTELGRFVDDDTLGVDDICIRYLHEKSGMQIIEYTAAGAAVTTKFYAILQGIMVHDHASIHQGGPAFATYYAEVPEEE